MLRKHHCILFPCLVFGTYGASCGYFIWRKTPQLIIPRINNERFKLLFNDDVSFFYRYSVIFIFKGLVMNQKKTKILKSDWPKPKKRWKPKDGEAFWYVSSFGHVIYWHLNPFRDNYIRGNYIKANNCFKTKTQAQSAAKKIKKLLRSL